jgi:hypothetical protein
LCYQAQTQAMEKKWIWPINLIQIKELLIIIAAEGGKDQNNLKSTWAKELWECSATTKTKYFIKLGLVKNQELTKISRRSSENSPSFFVIVV